MARQRKATLVEEAEERRRAAGGGDAGERAGEMAVLAEGGPWIGGAWYWRTELEARQQAERGHRARASAPKVNRDGGPLPGVRHYVPTQQWRTHPRGSEPYYEGAAARVWAYYPPSEGSKG